ncbi:hypothetical protein [Streptomyces meridianus]|uniref:Uncharacterized protein n=1 Tax=Streptomyces meridianus TaxID=2938945 RepID=A0ABT0X268_9ACTN|nr:hypothetical protein [Streptomyces meridianus]MCM2576642.1 hypothetical protein [Streptomyces meridianus]
MTPAEGNHHSGPAAPAAPLLPISPLLSDLPAGVHLTATEAHRVMLHCALDSAGVRLLSDDVLAVIRIAELNYPTVGAVVSWLGQTEHRHW